METKIDFNQGLRLNWSNSNSEMMINDDALKKTMNFVFVCGLVVWALSSVGCDTCENAEDCETNEYCNITEFSLSDDGISGEGECAPRLGSGEECVSDLDPCVSGLICDNTCIDACEETSDCDENAECERVANSFGDDMACYDKAPEGGVCKASSDCLTDHMCVIEDGSEDGICRKECDLPSDCPDDKECMGMSIFDQVCL